MMLLDLARICRGSGLDVVELPQWQHRTRPSSSGGFDPVGVCCHHTGGSADDRGYVESMAYVGRSDLPPPLCQLALSRAGTVYVCAAGRANHAGVCRARGKWLKAGDGNAQLVGIEALNTGSEGWTAAQYAAYVRLCAVLCLGYGWPASHVVAHKETSTTGKWDPGGIDMAKFRRDVGTAMRTGDFDTTPPQEDAVPNLDEIRSMVINPNAAKADQLQLGEALRIAANAAQRADDRNRRLLKLLAGIPDEVAEAVRADVAQGKGGLDPAELRRIVYAQAARAINNRLGSLDEGK